MDKNSLPTFKLLQGIWRHISFRRRLQMSALLMAMLASGAAELISLGSVLPFLAVLSDPDILWNQSYIRTAATRIGFSEASQLLIPSIICFAFAAIIAAGVRLCNLWLSGKLAASVGSDLSCEAYKRTLYQPFLVHVQRNSSTVIAASTSQISLTVAAINAILQTVTSAIVSIGLLTGLLIIDASIAAAAALIFGTAYSLLAITVNKELTVNSYKIADATKEQLRALQEGLGSIRDLLLDGSQSTFIDIYRRADRPQRLLEAKNSYLSSFPRYSIEALGMVVISMLGGFLVVQKGSGAAVIPTLGALALGAQRLLPALQQIYGGWASLKSYNAAMYGVLNMLNQPLPKITNKITPLAFEKKIVLKNVSFRYTEQSELILNNIDVEIQHGQRIGLIGATGSGKSTMIDVIMGLLPPTEGDLMVDGRRINNESETNLMESWRANIAHVPQTIYLADTSIAENIAFGVPKEKIDIAKVQLAAKQAQISSFIESNDQGYNSHVGERGIRLSGGQRQRIGIARALYKQADVLVFDEATSALDTNTEKSVMTAINSLSSKLTIILIAHRLSTVAGCDKIIELSKGNVQRTIYPSESPTTFQI